MPSDALRVSPARLRELAFTHRQAATEVTGAVDTVIEVHQRVRMSHGAVASPTAGVVETVEQARRAAGHGLAAQSRLLCDDLTAAAHRYETTDAASGTRIDRFPR